MCTCIETSNRLLASRNVKILEMQTFDKRRGIVPLGRATIALEKVDPKRRTQMPRLLADHCPFCGAKYPARDTPETVKPAAKPRRKR